MDYFKTELIKTKLAPLIQDQADVLRLPLV